MKAWYFSNGDRRLRNGDGREIKLGETHEVSGEIEMCSHGLHASKKLMDALYYAPGTIVYRVELSGEIKKGEDKLVAQKRTYLSGGIDVSETLRKFARMCALDVVGIWEAPEVVIRYLKTGDKSMLDTALDAARAAAWAAARDDAWAAAHGAAYDAAKAAARDAAYGDALDTAYADALDTALDTAPAAALAAARATARAAARATALAAAKSAAKYAARDAAYTASWDEARRKQNKRLTKMIARAIRDANFGGTND